MSGARAQASDGAALRRYYKERDYLTSAEGILKVVAVVVCIACAALALGGAACGGAAAGAVALAAAGALAALYAAGALALHACAPLACLVAELTVSSVTGVLLLVAAPLGLPLCGAARALDYVHAPLSLVNAGIVTVSTVMAYVSATRHLDAARGPAREPRPPPPLEQEV